MRAARREKRDARTVPVSTPPPSHSLVPPPHSHSRGDIPPNEYNVHVYVHVHVHVYVHTCIS